MDIRVLGCSGGICEGVHTTSFQIDQDILIDGGTGLGQLTLDEMAGLRHIFLTHSHLDHVAGLPMLVDSIFERIREPLVLHARAETIEAIKENIFNWVIWPDFSKLPTEDHPVIRYEVIEPGQRVDIGGRRIEAIAVNHVVPCVGYRIEANGKVFAFSGDTTTNDHFWDVLNRYSRLDMLFVECAFPDREMQLSRLAYHYCPQLLADDLAKLRHRPPLYISHLKPGMEEEIFRECEEAVSGFEIHRLFGGDRFQL